MKSALLLWAFLLSPSVFAQNSGRFAITRSVIASGGTTFSSSARFQLGSTIGQPLAAVPSSARFAIQGGFWTKGAPIIFAPNKVGNNFVFSLQTEPGKTYAVSYSTSLAGGSWQSITNFSGDGGVKTVTNAVAGAGQEFFRILEK